MIPPKADPAMMFLASLHPAVRFPHQAVNGELTVYVPGAGHQPVPATALDWLESRGWLDLSDEKPAITPKGKYWLERWAMKWHRPRT